MKGPEIILRSGESDGYQWVECDLCGEEITNDWHHDKTGDYCQHCWDRIHEDLTEITE